MIPTEASLQALYGMDRETLAAQEKRYQALEKRFIQQFPKQTDGRFFSAPGRAEIGGNHTDHQLGRVLAASVNLDTIACAAVNGTNIVHIESEGYSTIRVDLSNLSVQKNEKGTSGMIRGCAAKMASLGHPIGGFDASMTSSVFSGSGLSSSAAIEVLICTIFDNLFGDGTMTAKQKAIISQFAENEYAHKPSGLMDQMASAVGGIVAIDFYESDPEVTAIQFDFAAKGYTMAVVNTHSSHAGLNDAYGAITREMKQVAAFFGESVLSRVDERALYAAIPKLREKVSDRAILRAMHYFDENARVPQMVDALMENDLEAFFRLIIASGDSSWKLLQNVWTLPDSQPISLALAVSARMLQGKGAWRVHGGGFAGTILAFVPKDMYADYAAEMDAIFGKDACCAINVRAVGSAAL